MEKGGTWKLQKRGESMVQGQACISVWWWLQLTLFSFSSRFISFSLEITSPFEKLCYAFEKKNFFLLP